MLFVSCQYVFLILGSVLGLIHTSTLAELYISFSKQVLQNRTLLLLFILELNTRGTGLGHGVWKTRALGEPGLVSSSVVSFQLHDLGHVTLAL